MIREITCHELGGMYDPDGLFLICCKVPSDFVWFYYNYMMCPILIPKYEREYRVGLITKDEFEEKYRSQLRSPIVKEYIRYLKSLEQDVYLVDLVDYKFLAQSI